MYLGGMLLITANNFVVMENMMYTGIRCRCKQVTDIAIICLVSTNSFSIHSFRNYQGLGLSVQQHYDNFPLPKVKQKREKNAVVRVDVTIQY